MPNHSASLIVVTMKLARKLIDAFLIRGINHNVPFLAAVLAQERFRAGRLTTNYIAEEFPEGFHGLEPSEELTARPGTRSMPS